MKRFSIVLIVAMAALAMADDKPVARNASELKFGNAPALPTCFMMAVQAGDPNATAFTASIKTPTGCVIPWHWHTYSENLMIVSGTVHVAMRDDKGAPTMAKSLTAGGFVTMPPKHVHEFRCEKTCQLFFTSDGKFDIHYVDPKGNELQPAEALRGVKETATAMK